MNDDELRNRLARLDPQADAPVDPITSPRAQDLLERIMMTDTDSLPETQGPDRRRTRLLMGLTAGIAAAGIVTAVVLTNGGGTTHVTPKKSVLALNLPGGGGGVHPGGPSMGSCIRFDVAILKDMGLAFAGTATDVKADTVTLDVTHWYKGGSAQSVTLSNAAPGTPVSIEGGTVFEQGKDYLVSATNGTVTTCGYSGQATAELKQAYDQAFG